MLMQKNVFYITPFIVLCLVGIYSCIDSPDFSISPTISFIGFETDTVQQESLTTFKFSFQDGDGDLGSDQEPNVFLLDLRQEGAVAEPFVLAKLPVEGSGNGVEGVATIQYQATRCIYPNGKTGLENWQDGFQEYDPVVYELYIVDRAGNESNRVITDTLYLSCAPK